MNGPLLRKKPRTEKQQLFEGIIDVTLFDGVEELDRKGNSYLCCCFIVDTKVQVLLSSSVILNSLSSWLLTLEQRWALMVFIFSTWSIKVFFSRIKSFNFMKVFDTLRTIRVPFLVVISLKGPYMSLLNKFNHQIYGQIYFLWVEIFTDQIYR